MRKLYYSLIVVLTMSGVMAQKADFTVTTVTYGGMYRPRNVFAVWVTNANNVFIKSLRVAGLYPNFQNCLAKWISHGNYDVVDAVTSASFAGHGTRTATWDCTDKNGNEVPDGNYRIWYEQCESNGYVAAWRGPNDYIQFTKGVADQTVNGTDTYFSPGWTGNVNYGKSVLTMENAKVTYTAPAVSPGQISLTASTATTGEDGGSVTITASRSGGSSGAVSVSYTTANGTADAGTDYTAASGSFTWADGVTGNKSVQVAVTDDTLRENNENFTFTISSPTGSATLGSRTTFTVTIIDNDSPVSDDSLVGKWSFENNADDSSPAGNDGRWVGTPSYGPGKSGQGQLTGGFADDGYIEVPHSSDLDGMAALTLALWIKRAPNAPRNWVLHKHMSYYLEAQPTRFNGYIYNDSGTRHDFNISAPQLNNSDWHHLAVTYDGSSVIKYIDGMPQDTSSLTGKVAVNPTRVVSIGKNPWGTSLDGTVDEVRIYRRVLAAGEIATLAGDTGSVVTNPGTIQLTAAAFSVNENGGTVTVSAVRSGGTDGDVSVTIATSNGSATAGSDYTAASTTLNWADGTNSSRSVDITIANDSEVEGDETFTVTVSSPVGGAVLGSRTSATVTITDDDSQPRGLVCHYTFDGNVMDETGNGHNGTPHGNPQYVTGAKGEGLELNGTDQYVEGADIDFPEAPFTVAAFFKTTSTNVGPLIHKISDARNQNYYIYPVAGNSGVFCGFWDGTAWQEIGSGSVLNDGEWHHAAMVVTATSIEVYADGVKKGTTTHDNTIPTNDQPFNVGKQNNASVFFKGAVDELKIFNTALSAGEVAALAADTTMTTSMAEVPAGPASLKPVITRTADGRTLVRAAAGADAVLILRDVTGRVQGRYPVPGGKQIVIGQAVPKGLYYMGMYDGQSRWNGKVLIY